MKIVKAKHHWKEKLPGGRAEGKEPMDYNADQLGKGTVIEMEHTEDPALAAEIAMDHLEESDDRPGKPVGKYYDLLHNMEQVMEKRKDKAASEDDVITIKTAAFVEAEKKKKKKKKEWDPNPWAVCTESVGRDDKDKYEKCIMHVKKKQKD